MSSKISPQAAASELLKRRGARKSLIDFTQYTMDGFQASDHHLQICDALERVERGECKRLMIFAPPRHTKSELGSRRFPAWYLGRNPDKQIIATTYGHDFAADFGRDVRGILNGEHYRNLFDVALSQDSKSANRWHTDKGGVYITTGVGGAITGRGGHILLIDDPFKNREEADSELHREKVWKWYTSTLYTRQMPGASIVIILTRWHEDDLAGRLLEDEKNGGDKWEVINLEAIKNIDTPEEEALWPEWYSLDTLKQTRQVIGERDFWALYQQNPTPDEGIYFTQDSFKWYDSLPNELNYYGASDYAVTEGAGDFTEHGVFGINPNDDIYITDWWSGQTQSDEWIESQLDLVLKYGVMMWAGETGPIRKAVEPFLNLRMRQRRAFTNLEWMPTMANNKTAGARTFQALCNAGKIYLPTNTPWATELVNQLIRFPAGKYDDKVDVCSIFARMINEVWAASPEQGEPVLSGDRWDKAFSDRDYDEDDSWKLA
jgi:predicted phage terminase large subunit-like protein